MKVMKRCPECGRNYNDDSMSFCLDDGSELLFGPASVDEPATAILAEFGVPPSGGSSFESPTRAQIDTTDQTAFLHTGAEAEPRENLGDSSEKQSFSANRAAKLLAVAIVAVLILVGGFF